MVPIERDEPLIREYDHYKTIEDAMVQDLLSPQIMHLLFQHFDSFIIIKLKLQSNLLLFLFCLAGCS